MVFNCDSHQSLSENRGSQSESNEDPIRAYQKTEVLNQNPMKIPSEPIRKERICQNLTEALGKSWDFRFTIAKQTPPKKKGGPPFTIVNVTLLYYCYYYCDYYQYEHSYSMNILCMYMYLDRYHYIVPSYFSRAGNLRDSPHRVTAAVKRKR